MDVWTVEANRADNSGKPKPVKTGAGKAGVAKAGPPPKPNYDNWIPAIRSVLLVNPQSILNP